MRRDAVHLIAERAVAEPSERPHSKAAAAGRIQLLPVINSQRVDLLDDRKSIAQLVGLERRTSRGVGKDSIDHAPGGHDDRINAIAGAIVHASVRPPLRISQEMVELAGRPDPLRMREGTFF
jgi:hypothetical protein